MLREKAICPLCAKHFRQMQKKRMTKCAIWGETESWVHSFDWNKRSGSILQANSVGPKMPSLGLNSALFQ